MIIAHLLRDLLALLALAALWRVACALGGFLHCSLSLLFYASLSLIRGIAAAAKRCTYGSLSHCVGIGVVAKRWISCAYVKLRLKLQRKKFAMRIWWWRCGLGALVRAHACTACSNHVMWLISILILELFVEVAISFLRMRKALRAFIIIGWLSCHALSRQCSFLAAVGALRSDRAEYLCRRLVARLHVRLHSLFHNLLNF